MKLSDHVLHAFDDAISGKFDAALLHACIAVDATARRMFPDDKKVGRRFVNCLRQYYWVIEPMLSSGINLEETRFPNIKLKTTDSPDLAEIVYEVFRCSHAHGDEVPLEFSVLPTEGGFNSAWMLANGRLHMPDRIIWALLGVSIFAKVNRDEVTVTGHYLSLGDDQFPIRDWWGWEDHFRQIAARYNQVRVKLEGLGRLGRD